jgi:hypothetical protein
MVEQTDGKDALEEKKAYDKKIALAFIENYVDGSEQARRGAGCNNITKELNGLILG